jgi:hypothetical protein
MLGCHDQLMSHPLQVLAPVKKKELFYLFTYLFIHGLFKSSVSTSVSKCQMAEHLVTSKLERLCREAVRLQCDPVLMGILKDCTAFCFWAKQSKSRHVGQNVCVGVCSGWPE